MRELAISTLMFVGIVGWWVSSGVHRQAPLVGSLGHSDEVASLEAEVAIEPENIDKLSRLCRSYLERNAPGFALAAIHRAPSKVRQSPTITHLWARALLREGKASEALAKQRSVLLHCQSNACSSWLFASAMRHEAFLSAMVDNNVEDYRRDPDRTIQAYQTMQTSTVAMLEVP